MLIGDRTQTYSAMVRGGVSSAASKATKTADAGQAGSSGDAVDIGGVQSTTPARETKRGPLARALAATGAAVALSVAALTSGCAMLPTTYPYPEPGPAYCDPTFQVCEPNVYCDAYGCIPAGVPTDIIIYGGWHNGHHYDPHPDYGQHDHDTGHFPDGPHDPGHHHGGDWNPAPPPGHLPAPHPGSGFPGGGGEHHPGGHVPHETGRRF